MTRLLAICCALLDEATSSREHQSASHSLFGASQAVSTKLDFEEEKESSVSGTSSSKEDEDVEVKHTIVLSTKLKNNNRRGLHSTDGQSDALTYSIGGHRPNARKEDSGEVPIVKGYKSVESTVIRTPDTRDKPPIYTDSVFVSRNIGDLFDTYPVANNPSQWKPSSFFNNVNWWNDENASFNNVARRNWQGNRNQQNFHRKITDDGVKEFYCRKCRELSSGLGNRGCIQQRSNFFYENTTPKIKIDGKLAKLN